VGNASHTLRGKGGNSSDSLRGLRIESGQDFDPIKQVLVKAKGVWADQGPYQTENYK